VSRAGEVVRVGLRGVGEVLVTLGVVLLLFCVYELQITNLYTAQQQDALADDLRRAWAAPPAEPAREEPAASPSARPSATTGPSATAGPAATAGPTAAARPAARSAVAPAELGRGFAVLRVPRLGRDYAEVVVEGVTTAALRRGPGHYPGTALPGEVGNVVLSGHRTTYGAPFADLQRLRPGDAVVLETRDRWFTYRAIDELVVRPTAVEQIAPVPGRPGARPTRRLLTLTTCHPRYSARQRLVVRAELERSDPKGAGDVPAALAAPSGG
jgi:sortase A